MSEITVDKSEYPDLKNCKPGEQLDIDATVTAVNGDMLTLTVDDVSYADAETDQADVPPNPDVPSNPVKKIGMPKTAGY